MFGGLNRPLAAAAIATAALFVAPQAALAGGCNGKPSAEQVYRECPQTGSGGKPTSGGSGGSTSGTTTPYISKSTAKALEKAGADGQTLTTLVNDYGAVRMLQAHASGAAGEPTAVGSAFDLGSGPTALLIVLAGAAILLLGATGFRSYRRR